MKGKTTRVFDCTGLGGYLSRAAVWMSLPPWIITLVVLGTALRSRVAREAVAWQQQMSEVLDRSLRIMFLLYPSLVRVAFSAFGCYTFEGDLAWMKADPAIACGSQLHHIAQTWAVVLICCYVAGVPILFCVLLFHVFWVQGSAQRRPQGLFTGRGQLDGRKPRQDFVSRGVSFAYKDLKPEFCFWFVLTQVQQAILVGVLQLLRQGSLTQIVRAGVDPETCRSAAG